MSLTFPVIFHQINNNQIEDISFIENFIQAVSDACKLALDTACIYNDNPEINLVLYSEYVPMNLTYDEPDDTQSFATSEMIKSLGGYKRIKSNCDDECTICLDSYVVNEGVRDLKCNHRFHKRCIDKWFKKSITCPVCRSNAF